MPHLIVEYSANLDSDINMPTLLAHLTDTAVATGVFPLAGIRARAHRCEHYHVATGDPGFGFVHLHIKLGAGRSEKVKAEAAGVIFTALTDHLQPLYQRQGLAISFEMTELPVTLKFNHNNIRDYLDQG